MSLADLIPHLPTPARYKRTAARIRTLDALLNIYVSHHPPTARVLLAHRRRLIIDLTGLTPEHILEIANS